MGKAEVDKIETVEIVRVERPKRVSQAIRALADLVLHEMYAQAKADVGGDSVAAILQPCKDEWCAENAALMKAAGVEDKDITIRWTGWENRINISFRTGSSTDVTVSADQDMAVRGWTTEAAKEAHGKLKQFILADLELRKLHNVVKSTQTGRVRRSRYQSSPSWTQVRREVKSRVCNAIIDRGIEVKFGTSIEQKKVVTLAKALREPITSYIKEVCS